MTSSVRVPISPSRGITHLRRRNAVAHISFAPPRQGGPRLHEIFGGLSRSNINLFFIKKSPNEISLGMDSSQGEQALEILAGVGVDAKAERECAVACVVASNMKYAPGVMHRIVRALDKAGIRLFSTSDSFNSLSCLVPSEDIEAAMKALGEEFGIEESAAPGPLDPW